MQPINGRLLVRVVKNGEYKHVNLGSDKKYESAGSYGTILAVSPDIEHIIRQALKLDSKDWIEGLPRPKDLVGKVVRWEKFAEQNTLHKFIDPATKEEYQVALINYKDVIGYEG